ncbi:OLC1v1038741C1 [Oldenlandia corymbosa var. corymbosa]|uniref:OLC1v1038741C1 n=1 Tax=Oldenlandia corymbosa var. corymbosa TaxID=529605 RepID=A0AAV1D1P6_OLDCO|nr:OLC1v1038741C1 [Oldenlandia corymbosa var. corymbosa]
MMEVVVNEDDPEATLEIRDDNYYLVSQSHRRPSEWRDPEVWEKYWQEMHDSQGYEVRTNLDITFIAQIMPWDFKEGGEILPFFHEICEDCIQHYNDNHEGRKYREYANVVDYACIL